METLESFQLPVYYAKIDANSGENALMVYLSRVTELRGKSVLKMKDDKMVTEKDNICNLPVVALIEIHRSDETGIKYVSFISWDDDSGIGIKKGRWIEKRISENDLTKIVKVLTGESQE